MKILFLDQSGNPGGAELCLIDIAKPYRDRCLVSLFVDGPFRHFLEQQHIPVQILGTRSLQVRKSSSLVEGIGSLRQLAPMITQVARTARAYNLIYANTQKALVVGALASLISRRPLVYHLHDILSLDHFSQTNRRLAVTLANRFASLVIANSQASQAAFIAAGGRSDITQVVYNGFEPELYDNPEFNNHSLLRQELGLEGQFVVGNFSRLSPWKGQHVLIEALVHCPLDVTAIFIGDALFGEHDYVKQLHERVKALGLEERVRFLGFRSNIAQLMAVCDLVAHTSTRPEPFGRVIVEAMLCKRPIVATQSGGATELVEPGINGFLVPPDAPQQLAQVITNCRNQPEHTTTIAHQARDTASQRFHLTNINQQIAQLLCQVVETHKKVLVR